MFQPADQQLFNTNVSDPSLGLCIAASNIVKSAAFGIGGEQAAPTVYGNHGAGIMDPDPSNARHSMQSEVRSQSNRMNYTDGQAQGTNALPYRQILPENYQAVQVLMNVPMMGKSASEVSNDEAPTFDLTKQADFDSYMGQLADQGIFKKFVPRTLDEYNKILEKSASLATQVAKNNISDMLDKGYIDQVIPCIKNLLV